MKRHALGALAVVLPAASPVLFALWLEVSPKAGLDRTCGLSEVTTLSSVLFLLVPPAVAGLWARRSGRGGLDTAFLVAAALVATTIGCLLAFLFWFGKHMCGE